MKKIVTIAIRHPEQQNLFLHGLRRDNHKWALAGGHAKSGETELESAQRELQEETGLSGVKLEKLHQNQYGDCDVHLFACDYPANFKPDAKNDPDGEFVVFKFLDPTTHSNLHIPAERNILSQWMHKAFKVPEEISKGLTAEQESETIKENKKKPEAHERHKFKAAQWTHPNGHPRCIICGDEERTGGYCEPLAKASPKIKVQPFMADPELFNPRKHDFIVRAHLKGKQVGFMAVTHTPAGLMPFNFEVNKLHRRKGIGTAMAQHAQKISGKKITRSPDMTQDAVHWANKFIKPIVKNEQMPEQEDVTLSYPVTINGRALGEDGSPFFLHVKNFGPLMGSMLQNVMGVIEQHRLGAPLNPSKLVFVPTKLGGLQGEKHVVVVHGLPERVSHLKAATSAVGPNSTSDVPYIHVDEATFDRLMNAGPALTSVDADIQIHPAELKSGTAVLKTY